MDKIMKRTLSNTELITLAVYLLGGDSKYIDTEDVAIKANELAPGRFSWRKYPEQINIHNIGKRLCDGRKPEKGGYIIGSFKQGWILSETGLDFSKKQVKHVQDIDMASSILNTKEMLWQEREKARMLVSIAFEKMSKLNGKAVTVQDAEAFFRVDDYVTGKARERKLDRIIRTFGNDPELGQAIKILVKKVRKK
jgi:hypothetical protein